MAENWYIVLELSFDPPVEDEQKIEERLIERSKFWSAHFNDFKIGAQCRAWNQAIPQIRKDMIGPANIRKQLAAEACDIVYGPVDKLLKTIGRKGYITPTEVDKLSKNKKLSPDVVKGRAAKLGIRLEAAAAGKDYQAVYDKYYKTKPQKAAVFDGLRQMLETFHAGDLYQFLYMGTTIKDANRLPYDKLKQRAIEKKGEFKKHDSVSGTGSKLCGQCELTFADETSKETYDRYLEYTQRKAILDQAKSVADISGELAQEQCRDYVGQLTQIFRDRVQAEELFVAFCKVEKLVFSLAEASSGKSGNIKVCRCGCINDVSDGRKVCSSCGLELVIKCPKCGAENDASINVCKCGFRFENLDKAMALCEQAEYAMQTLDFPVARAHLSDAHRYWPGNSRIQALQGQLAEYEKRVGGEVAKLRSAMKDRRYWEAQRQYAALQKLFPGYQDAGMEEEIAQAVEKAQLLLQKAKAAKLELDILELCAQAYELCVDLPGVRELMPPPAPATGFAVRTDPRARVNIISWVGGSDRSVKYTVVRSESGWVQHLADGEVIFRGSGDSYSDKDILPGVSYYYNVFAERAGLFSQGAKGDFQPAVNLFEVKNVTAAAADGTLQLNWDLLPKGATAEISQISPPGKALLAASQAGGYLVSGLQNGTVYQFHVRLAYGVNGKKCVTPGVVVSGVPDRPPQPVDSLRVKPSQDGNFEANWYQEEGMEVRLYCAAQKPSYELGDVVSLEALEREMQPLQLLPLSRPSQQKLKAGERGACFRHQGGGLLYLVAVVLMSGSAVFGSLARASLGETVTVREARPINGKIHIFIDPPKDASGFVVLYRFDQFPTDISDVKTVRKYIPIKQYQLTSSLVLDTMDERKYYLSVFAEFKRDGEKDYSFGADYLFDNSPRTSITYSIAVSRKIFGGSSVQLEFTAGGREFDLPDIDVMYAVGNAPMFKASAQLFHAIPSQHVNDSLRVQVPLPKGLSRDTYIKAFFRDEAETNRGQLQIKLGSSYKIS